MLQYCNIGLKKFHYNKMNSSAEQHLPQQSTPIPIPRRSSSNELRGKLARHKSNPVLIPETSAPGPECAESKGLVITPHTPPREDPNAILRDKITRRVSDKLFGAQ